MYRKYCKIVWISCFSCECRVSVQLGRWVSILFCVFWDLAIFCLDHVAGGCRFEAVGEFWYYMMMLSY